MYRLDSDSAIVDKFVQGEMNKKQKSVVKHYAKRCGYSCTLLAVAIAAFMVGVFAVFFTDSLVYCTKSHWFSHNYENNNGSDCILIYSSDQLRNYLTSYVNKRQCKFETMMPEQWVDYYAMQIHLIHHSNTSSHNFEDAFHKLYELQDLANKSCDFSKAK